MCDRPHIWPLFVMSGFEDYKSLEGLGKREASAALFEKVQWGKIMTSGVFLDHKKVCLRFRVLASGIPGSRCVVDLFRLFWSFVLTPLLPRFFR